MTQEQTAWLVSRFEDHTLPKEQWTHTAHCMVALWYCIKYPLPLAVQKIRKGIQSYNISIGGANTDTSGYHETITLFYTTKIADYLITKGILELTDEQIALFLQQPFLARDYIFHFYDTGRLLSKEARRYWVSPDVPDLLHQPISPKSVSSLHGRPPAS
ncbi:MAG: hypothetical protein J0H74_15825 [Chitinophagaceae bacterium]|nr:hypothetical protein [Chitinophagaceae bacterium]